MHTCTIDYLEFLLELFISCSHPICHVCVSYIYIKQGKEHQTKVMPHTSVYSLYHTNGSRLMNWVSTVNKHLSTLLSKIISRRWINPSGFCWFLVHSISPYIPRFSLEHRSNVCTFLPSTVPSSNLCRSYSDREPCMLGCNWGLCSILRTITLTKQYGQSKYDYSGEVPSLEIVRIVLIFLAKMTLLSTGNDCPCVPVIATPAQYFYSEKSSILWWRSGDLLWWL